MSTSVIDVLQDGHSHTVNPSQVSLAQGDTLEFVNSPGKDLLLVFSPSLAELLSPSGGEPGETEVELSAGSSRSFEIGKPTGGPYSCQIVPVGADTSGLTWPDSGAGPVLTIIPGLSLSGFAEIIEPAGAIVPSVDR